MLRRSLLSALLLLALTAGAIAYFVTRPAATLAAIHQAINDKRYPDLNALVDFPALRESVKADLIRQLESRTGMSSEVGNIIGGMVIGPVVDLIVSPVGLDLVLDGYSARESAANARARRDRPVDEKPAENQPAGRKISYASDWQSLSRYDVMISRDGKPVSTLTLRRYGLFTWKLAAIDMAA
ncbi:MAG TPA: DUF2939 domain-containing protein [Noviherbaspirillum sp.]|jgi:hypothetical protein|uniref:DUF2939 domain-containing protein n=1 Tax=Noviherbaspirillum sp. TaxID=1926288 RepID=UPI002DDD0427|nr:DUF2939 domain-containing protein [Noviherbaspirillum sp.]HEV2611821.1 DUF2939 domain-containing protein [Noviherbaspirillum sp.]